MRIMPRSRRAVTTITEISRSYFAAEPAKQNASLPVWPEAYISLKRHSRR
jgi:hypothetical protein